MLFLEKDRTVLTEISIGDINKKIRIDISVDSQSGNHRARLKAIANAMGKSIGTSVPIITPLDNDEYYDYDYYRNHNGVQTEDDTMHMLPLITGFVTIKQKELNSFANTKDPNEQDARRKELKKEFEEYYKDNINSRGNPKVTKIRSDANKFIDDKRRGI